MRGKHQEDLPPPVALKQNAPRQTKLSTPDSNGRAVSVIQAPYAETSQKDRDAVYDHRPLSLQYTAVSAIDGRSFGPLLRRRLPSQRGIVPYPLRSAPRRAQSLLHDEDAPENHSDGQ